MDILDAAANFLSTSNIAFTVLDYPMSWIEFIGTILYLSSVLLIARRHLLTWPIGIASSILYMLLFYQIRLYADTFEQLYYIIASIYGWWLWGKTRDDSRTGDSAAVRVRYSKPSTAILILGCTLLISLAVGIFISRAHLLLPVVFPAPAAFPYLDAVTTIMSFTAMWLMALKRVESWVYWIVVDVIGIGLYFAQNVRFLSLLYVVLLVMAVNGLMSWHRSTRTASP